MRPITFAIIIVGIVSLVILFTSTNVFSLLSEQHAFINIDSSSNDIDCVPCHSRIQDELDNSSLHGSLSCEDCHRFNGTGISFAEGGSPATTGEEAHAAYTPRCLDCHDSDGTTVGGKYAKPARAFCDENYGCEYSAHRALVMKANESSMSVGENEACLVCHTSYSCELDYTYFEGISYNLSSWNFTSFGDSGTRVYTTNWSKSGPKHEFLSLDNIDCTKCHENIYKALVYGTSGTPDDYLTHAPIEISSLGSQGRRWNTNNAWGNDRYHYVPEANRAMGVNNSYCYECHNVNKYADDNPTLPSYNLTDVAADTNSSDVHCAEALWCQTCHGSTKTKKVIDNDDYPSGSATAEGHSDASSYADFVDDVSSDYARTFQGDICMGCHEAAVHPSSGTGTEHCTRCHDFGNAKVDIESEPSGLATNTW